MSLFSGPEVYDDASAFLGRLGELQHLARNSRQQVHIPQSRDNRDFSLAVLREDITFPRILTGNVYRGQANADWGLIPSVFRNGSLHKVHDGLPDRFTWDHEFWFSHFVSAEFEVVAAFSWMAQEIGLQTPHKAGKFERLRALLKQQIPQEAVAEHFDKICDLTNPDFSEIAEELAVAQHHGIPTRLLDWTEDPFMAAYFAASKPMPETDISVFVLSTVDFFYPETETAITDYLSLVRTPRSTENFIQRQKGLFTLPRQLLTKHRAHNFDLVEIIKGIDEGKKHGSELRKIVLKSEAVNTLREILYDRGYRYHTVFPSLSNIRQSIQEARELFGTGVHEYVDLSKDRTFEVKSDGKRFHLKPKTGE